MRRSPRGSRRRRPRVPATRADGGDVQRKSRNIGVVVREELLAGAASRPRIAADGAHATSIGADPGGDDRSVVTVGAATLPAERRGRPEPPPHRPCRHRQHAGEEPQLPAVKMLPSRCSGRVKSMPICRATRSPAMPAGPTGPATMATRPSRRAATPVPSGRQELARHHRGGQGRGRGGVAAGQR